VTVISTATNKSVHTIQIPQAGYHSVLENLAMNKTGSRLYATNSTFDLVSTPPGTLSVIPI
jgi:DNA-binding beta-propeller fold protein YncE